MKISVPILLGVLSLASCSEKDRSSEMVAQLNTADTFLFDFPKFQEKFDSIFRKQKSYTEKALGLQPLEKGFDSIQIRIWYGSSFTEERVISLINIDNKWTAEVSKLDSYPNPEYNAQSNKNAYYEEYIPSRTIEYKSPKSGWDRFIRRLFKLNILSLPDERKVAGINIGAVSDGWGVTVEIATKKVYRSYGYGNPDIYYKEIEQARNINQILILIDKEFGLKKIGDYTDEIPHIRPESDSSKIIRPVEIKLQDIKPEKKKKKK